MGETLKLYMSFKILKCVIEENLSLCKVYFGGGCNLDILMKQDCDGFVIKQTIILENKKKYKEGEYFLNIMNLPFKELVITKDEG